MPDDFDDGILTTVTSQGSGSAMVIRESNHGGPDYHHSNNCERNLHDCGNYDFSFSPPVAKRSFDAYACSQESVVVTSITTAGDENKPQASYSDINDDSPAKNTRAAAAALKLKSSPTKRDNSTSPPENGGGSSGKKKKIVPNASFSTQDKAPERGKHMFAMFSCE